MFSESVLHWIAKEVSKYHEKDARAGLLTLIRDRPSELAEALRPRIGDWISQACLVDQLVEAIVIVEDEAEQAMLVVEHWKKHFASEIAALPTD